MVGNLHLWDSIGIIEIVFKDPNIVLDVMGVLAMCLLIERESVEEARLSRRLRKLIKVTREYSEIEARINITIVLEGVARV